MNGGDAAASIAASERRMGYAPGPTPQRHRGDFDRPASLIGHPPLVTRHDDLDGWRARVDDAFGRACLVVVFVMWVIVPVCGGLALILH